MTKPKKNSSSSASNVTPMVLQEELNSIVNQLVNFKPEARKRPGRPKAKPEFDDALSDPPISDILTSICELTQKLVVGLGEVQKDNNILRARISNLEQDQAASSSSSNQAPRVEASYAAIVSGKNLPTPTAINQIDSRLDQVEQKSLATTLKLDGTVIIKKLSEPNTDHAKIKKSLPTIINKIRPNVVSEEDIESVSIVGRERKHLKVNFTTLESKLVVLKSIKESKPTNLFASQYLTKNRSLSLYRLRNIQRANSELISSVYVYGGNICCRLTDSDKIHHLNSSISIDAFESQLRKNNLVPDNDLDSEPNSDSDE